MTAALTRALAAVRLDLRLQRRSGVLVAVTLIAIVWVVGLRALPTELRRTALPVVVALDLATVGVYVIAAAVLMEKAQGVLAALAVSPLRPGEHLAGKVGSLALTASGLAAVVVVGSAVGPLAVAPLAAGTVLTAVAALLGGFVLVARHDGIATYLLPSGVLAAILVLPPIARVLGAPEALLLGLPTGGGYVLVAAGTAATGSGLLLLAATCQGAWVVLLWRAGLRAHQRHLASEAVW